jgi:hypothetical protein
VKIMTVLKKAFGPGLLFALLTMLSSTQGLAHHSFAMFEHENQIKLTGTVGRFQWTNPHVYIELEVVGEDGEARVWTIECASPGILSRIGWKFNIMKPGDEITVIVGPLKTGEPGALLKQVTLADGTKMGNGGPAGEPNIE